LIQVADLHRIMGPDAAPVPAARPRLVVVDAGVDEQGLALDPRDDARDVVVCVGRQLRR
jgi:hypothetical protein